MFKPLCLAALMLWGPCTRAQEAALTDGERKWIAAGMPVVRDARRQALPVDIVVQPGAQPDASPIAMAIKDGRCKLVLSLRGNPGADALLASLPAKLFDAAAEAVFAHEVGHCWRYVRGAWNVLPAGFSDGGDEPGDSAQLAELKRGMSLTRREEGYADLVGLAWTRRAHPAQYAAVLHWLEQFRDDGPSGTHHDTSAWLHLARDPAAFDTAGDVFHQAEALWAQGLRAAD